MDGCIFEGQIPVRVKHNDLDERQAHLMISQFDRGRGALSLDDFRRVVRVAGRAP